MLLRSLLHQNVRHFLGKQRAERLPREQYQFFHTDFQAPCKNHRLPKLWGQKNVTFRGRTIRKLMRCGVGGGGRGGVKKIYSRNGKLNEKNSCTPIKPEKYSCYGLKKIHTRNLITKKKFLRLENSPSPPPPTITFLMVRP